MRRMTAIAALALIPALLLALRTGRTSSTSAGPDRAAGQGDAPGGLVARTRYRLHYAQQIAMPGKSPTVVRVDGRWTTTPRVDGRIEVRFAPDVPDGIDGPRGELPAAGDVQAPIQLVLQGGVLTGFGFPAAMPLPARNLLTGLATTFQYSSAAGASWTRLEEDLTGSYGAVYQRAAGQVDRHRTAYTALRGASGLSPASRDRVTPDEQSRFQLDDDGLSSASIALDVTIALEGMPSFQVQVRGALEREAIERVPPAGGPGLAIAPITLQVDEVAARRAADRSTVDGATVEGLLAEVDRVAALAAGAETPKLRARTLSRLAALLRVEPGAAAAVADHVRAHPDDVSAARLLTGALSSAGTREATNSLAHLTAAPLPGATRDAVMGALALSTPATVDSLRALSDVVAHGYDRQAALALGIHGRLGQGDVPDGSRAASELLRTRYAQAGSDAERRTYVQALGNTGDPGALPILERALHGGERGLASPAVFSLRFIAGTDADALLDAALAQPELALAAVRAIGYRDPARWRDRLVQVQALYADRAGIQDEIRGILRRWS